MPPQRPSTRVTAALAAERRQGAQHRAGFRLIIGGLISGAALRDDREGGIGRPIACSSLLTLSGRGRLRPLPPKLARVTPNERAGMFPGGLAFCDFFLVNSRLITS